jgi:hypothetical protein
VNTEELLTAMIGKLRVYKRTEPSGRVERNQPSRPRLLGPERNTRRKESSPQLPAEDHPLDSLDKFMLRTHVNELAGRYSQDRVKQARLNLKSIFDEAIEQEFLIEGSVKDIQAHLRHSRPDTTTSEYMQELPDSVQQMVGSVDLVLTRGGEGILGVICYQIATNFRRGGPMGWPCGISPAFFSFEWALSSWSGFCKQHQFGSLSPAFVFAFSLPFHTLLRYPAGMPAPNGIRYRWCAVKESVAVGMCRPPSESGLVGPITALRPVCLERRSYIVSTEIFMGSPSWDVMRAMQGRR